MTATEMGVTATGMAMTATEMGVTAAGMAMTATEMGVTATAMAVTTFETAEIPLARAAIPPGRTIVDVAYRQTAPQAGQAPGLGQGPMRVGGSGRLVGSIRSAAAFTPLQAAHRGRRLARALEAARASARLIPQKWQLPSQKVCALALSVM